MTAGEAKIKSHEFLISNKIQINETLPLIESPEELAPQTTEAIARRCVILCHVIGIGFDANVPKLKDALVRWDLFKYASAEEQALLSRTDHSKQEKVNATWLTECVQSLAWCLGFVELSPFRGCDDDLASNFPAPFTDPHSFIQNAVARPFEAIYQQADLHYRLHWAARDARLNGNKCPVKEDLISERRKGLDWVIGVDPDWDEITLST